MRSPTRDPILILLLVFSVKSLLAVIAIVFDAKTVMLLVNAFTLILLNELNVELLLAVTTRLFEAYNAILLVAAVIVKNIFDFCEYTLTSPPSAPTLTLL